MDVKTHEVSITDETWQHIQKKAAAMNGSPHNLADKLLRKMLNAAPDMVARIEALEDHIQNMIDLSGQECACGYDNPDDVCLGHASLLNKVAALEAEVTRLREALSDVAYRSAAPDDLQWCRRVARAALAEGGDT